MLIEILCIGVRHVAQMSSCKVIDVLFLLVCKSFTKLFECSNGCIGD